MKLVHFADTHIGFRQYYREAPGGINQREMDVERAFTCAIDKTIEIAPELVVIGGDVFHVVRPNNHAIRFAYTEFARLKASLPNTDVILVAGNHDTPRTSDTGYILPLFEALGIVVACGAPKRLSLRNGELSVFAVPHMHSFPEFEPNADAKYNVLVIHTGLAGVMGKLIGKDNLKPEQLNAAKWDYVALGDYHVYQQIAPNAYYSGSIEYTSSDIWREVDKENARPEGRGKGIIERNLATGGHQFHMLAANREIVDLPAINATGLSADALSDAIVTAATEYGIENKVVRQVVLDVRKHVVRDLDHRAVRRLKGMALNYLLDTRVPEELSVANVGAAVKRRIPVNDFVRQELAAREIGPGIDRDELIELAMKYLGMADEKLAGSAAPEPVEAAA